VKDPVELSHGDLFIIVRVFDGRLGGIEFRVTFSLLVQLEGK
jgi:hypothetical protein